MRSPKNKELFGSLRLFGSTPRNRPHRLLMSPVPGGEKKKDALEYSIVQLLGCLPRAPNTGATNKNPPRVPPRHQAVEPDHTCQWPPVRGALLVAKCAVAAAPPSQLHRIRSHPTERNAGAIMPPRGARGPLGHWSVTHSLVALATIIADTTRRREEKGVSEE